LVNPRAATTSDRTGLRWLIPLAALVILTLLGTTGYVLVEHASWFDALYMTVVTLSTVGFGEVIPLSHAGRWFTMALILSGVGTAAYFFTTLAQLLALDVLSKLSTVNSMQNKIDRMAQHVIVCGYGRLGRTVVEELARAKVPLVVVESDPAKQAELEQTKQPFLLGNATSDEVLLSAGLDRARAIVAGIGSDPDNVFITLAARERRPELMIHARGETPESIRRLRQAGADYVMSPLQMGGISLAASISRPSVAQFLEIAHPRAGSVVNLEEVRVAQDASLIGKSLAMIEAEHKRLRVVALMRDDRTDLIPDTHASICAGDYLVVIGERTSLEQLASAASRPTAQATK
jgi:voltage-gated potassium channel